MKKLLLNFLFLYKNNKDNKIYSIQELNELRQREKKYQLARKSREYISELNKKQRLWLDKTNRNFKKS